MDNSLTLYSLIKTLHISCAIVSITGFAIRATLKLRESVLLTQRWLKITPHVIDSLLLASAIFLAVSSRQYPLQSGWLTAKVIALLLYIAVGFMAMRTTKNKLQQLFLVIVALLVAGYIFAVAINRNPIPI